MKEKREIGREGWRGREGGTERAREGGRGEEEGRKRKKHEERKRDITMRRR